MARQFGFTCLLCGFSLCATLAQAQSGARQRPSLTASLESSGAQYLLILDNNSDREFRGSVRLSLGKDGSHTEAGQLALVLPPNDTKALLLKAVQASGDQYLLQIFDQQGALVFYKVASVRSVTGATPGNAESVSLSKGLPPSATPPTVANAPPPAAAKEPPPPEAQIKVRLIAGAQENDSFVLAFDLAAEKAILNATFDLVIGKTKESKPVTLNKHAVVEFKLPEYLDSNQIVYRLLRKDGSVIAEGVTEMDKLFADDHVTVADIRTDRVAYSPGETARLTIALEGISPHGFKLEVIARDFGGKTFFTDTALGAAGEEVKEKEFSFLLPVDVKGPVVIEFKVSDGETTLLFDSGEREIAVKEPKGT
ncbi:MAG: hypothetical protein HYR56_09535 [Acidobacteria bacterium]|nr:hypothetical protein [Acidobacteriota bacterium]MBI3424988.1 hypothetical protein [Acidobacteriota bacterium]